MPKHTGVMPGDTDKELNDGQNIPPLLVKDQISGGVVLTYRFRTATSRNTKNSFGEDPREGVLRLTVRHRLGNYTGAHLQSGEPAQRAKRLHSASDLQLLFSWTRTCFLFPQI